MFEFFQFVYGTDLSDIDHPHYFVHHRSFLQHTHWYLFLTGVECPIIQDQAKHSKAHRVELAVHEQAQCDICVPGAANFFFYDTPPKLNILVAW